MPFLLRSQAQYFRHPKTTAPLELREIRSDGDQVVTGVLTDGQAVFPVDRGIPRFVPSQNYARSFGYQWQTFPKAQLDSHTEWGGESERRLFEETGWPRRMEGQTILEAASGMGRFTEILARTGAQICTFDYSEAVDANRDNNGKSANVSFAQADIYDPPYAHESFDKILCIGALQHCPSPRGAFESLLRFLKPGGEIVVDVYRLYWQSALLGKYYLRPVTSRLPPELLHRLVKRHVAWVYPFTGWLQGRIGRRGRSLSWMLGVADARGRYAMDDTVARTLSELDTFDMLSPAFDRPQTLRTVRKWFADAGLDDVDVRPGYNGIQARGRKPISAA